MSKYIIMVCSIFIMLAGCQEPDSATKMNEEHHTIEKSEVNSSSANSEKEKNNDISQSNERDLNHTEVPQKQQTTSNKNGELAVHYIDVGQGDATLLQYNEKGTSYTILYDTGDWLGNEVVPFLEKKEIAFIDLIIVSHPHADHIGQLEKVLQHFEVGEVWMTGNTANTEVFQNALQAILDKDIDYIEPRAGEIYDIGPLTLSILHPEKLTGALNNDSLSVHILYDEISFMFTGDAGKVEERMMLNRKLPIQATYLQLGHHGSNTSTATEFISHVQPSAAIYSAGKGNTYNHPHKEVVSLLQKKGIKLYGTDIYGTITITTDGKQSVIKTEHKGNLKGTTKEVTIDKQQANEDCIDINHASEQELMTISHIGEVRAKEIIQLRPFQSIHDLRQVKGIGEKRLKDIKKQHNICIGGNSS